jgi:hypothetical protein
VAKDELRLQDLLHSNTLLVTQRVVTEHQAVTNVPRSRTCFYNFVDVFTSFPVFLFKLADIFPLLSRNVRSILLQAESNDGPARFSLLLIFMFFCVHFEIRSSYRLSRRSFLQFIQSNAGQFHATTSFQILYLHDMHNPVV